MPLPRGTEPPTPRRRAGWGPGPSKVLSRVGVVCATVPANAQFLRVPPSASLSTTVSTAQVCSKPSVGCGGVHRMPLWGPGVLNSYWVGEDSTYQSLRLLIHSIKLSEETLTPSGSLNQSTGSGRGRADDCGQKRPRARPGLRVPPPYGGRVAWRRRNALQLHRYRQYK